MVPTNKPYTTRLKSKVYLIFPNQINTFLTGPAELINMEAFYTTMEMETNFGSPQNQKCLGLVEKTHTIFSASFNSDSFIPGCICGSPGTPRELRASNPAADVCGIIPELAAARDASPATPEATLTPGGKPGSPGIGPMPGGRPCDIYQINYIYMYNTSGSCSLSP